MFKLIISAANANEHQIYWLEFIPAVSVAIAFIIGLIAAAIAFFNVNRQLAHSRLQLASSYWEERGEALRSKRATAKSLLQEIQTMRPYLDKGLWVEAVVYEKLVGEIGRLSTDCIGAVIGFHTELFLLSKQGQAGSAVDVSTVVRMADEAVKHLKTFMETTRLELDETQQKIKQHKL